MTPRRTLESYFAERAWQEHYAAHVKEAYHIKWLCERGIIEYGEDGRPARYYPYVGST